MCCYFGGYDKGRGVKPLQGFYIVSTTAQRDTPQFALARPGWQLTAEAAHIIYLTLAPTGVNPQPCNVALKP